MRIIEPHEIAATRKRRLAHKRGYSKVVIPVVVITAVIAGLGIYGYNKPEAKPSVASAQHNNTPTQKQQAEAAVPKVLRTFTGPEFLTFYNGIAYPNVREVTDAPSITGDADADDRIRSIAVARGYVQRSIAVPPIEKIDGYQLQYLAIQPWRDMKAAAAKAGIHLAITAGFRSIEDQRALFLQRLYSTGATAGGVAGGYSDLAVENTLERTAIPGYTRHHTGYTVDIGCDNDQSVVFSASPCFPWLSANNYENAKKFGWIPSYPDGAPNQGPDPESWEYVWVGVEALSVPASSPNVGG